MNNFIQLVKKQKKQLKMSNNELAMLAKVPVGTLNKILSMQTKSIKDDVKQRIIKALSLNESSVNINSDNLENITKSQLYSSNFGFITCTTITPKIIPCDIEYNKNSIISELDKIDCYVDLIVFPELCISSYSSSDMFYQPLLLSKVEGALIEIVKSCKDKKFVGVLGCPLKHNNKVYNTAVVFCAGEILAVIPKSYLPTYNEFYEDRQFVACDFINDRITILDKDCTFSKNVIFKNIENKNFTFAVEICEDLWVANSPSINHSMAGANIICNLSASNEIIGKAEYRKNLVAIQSAKCVCGYIYANCGNFESTTDIVYSGHSIIAENGNVLKENELFSNDSVEAQIDVNYLSFEKSKLKTSKNFDNSNYQYINFRINKKVDCLMRNYPRFPFVPCNELERDKRVDLIIRLQAEGLKRRVERINCKSLIIGLSGGLDSTLALLVCHKAMQLLNKSTKDIIAVTMPCFGTTNRTKSNSHKLANALGVTIFEIDITKAVRVHLNDIGHDENIMDVVYENAQARERTKVLMNLANKYAGIVVGTGDLSELALGFATYNGDHMSMYGVNCSIPKTLIRHMVQHIAKISDSKIKDVLNSIADTPVSPELIPPSGEDISQITEDIVGPYELHDFYLYYMLRCGFEPSKIYYIAKKTFKNIYSDDVIYKWLKVFIRRFFSQQFKRSAMPDGVKVGTVALSPRGDLRMPSDASCSLWLEDLERAVKNQ